MTLLLLFIATILLLSVLLSKLSTHVGIPVLLAFLFLGMLFGSDGLAQISFENYDFANQISTVALLSIIFYGGFGTNWKAARRVALPSILLSTLGVLLTAGLTALFCALVLRFPWQESFLLGAVLSSTDAASVFSILRSKRLSLRFHTASMLELESGSNDPFSYTLTCLALALLGGGLTPGMAFRLAAGQILFGLACGAGLAALSVWFLRRLPRGTSGYGPLVIVGIALFSYALPTAIGGNGYLSAYLVGIILGGEKWPEKKELVHFLDGVTSLMQLTLFFLLGLLSFPSRLPAVLPTALAVTLFLTLLARPAAVALLLAPFRAPFRQQMLVAWSGLRGATSIVFAILAVMDQASLSRDLFHIVFCVVLLSIGVQGTLLPWCAKRLDMIDDREDVLKTFSDYSEDTPIQFIQLSIGAEHPWKGIPLREAPLPPDTRAAMVLRQGERILPRGDTALESGDILVLSALAYAETAQLSLSEVILSPEHDWTGQPISAVDWGGSSVLLVLRGEETLIPTGDLVLQAGDLLVLADDPLPEPSF